MNKFSKIISVILFIFVILIILITPLLYFAKSNILDLLGNKRFLNALLFGVKTSVIATFFSFFLGVPAGFFLARNKGFFSKLLDIFFELPIIVPPLIVGVLLLQIFNFKYVKSLFDFIFTWQGAVIAQFFISFPFTLKSSKNSFDIIPPIYEQIAMTLGANPWRSFFDTTLKLSYGGILTGVLLSFIRCFGEFGATLLVAGGIAGKTENVPIYIYLSISEGDFNKGIAATFLMVILAFAAIGLIRIIFKQRYVQE